MSQLVSRASSDLNGCVTVVMGRRRDMVSPATVLFFIIIVVVVVGIIIIMTIKAVPQMSQLVSKSTRVGGGGRERGERDNDNYRHYIYYHIMLWKSGLVASQPVVRELVRFSRWLVFSR